MFSRLFLLFTLIPILELYTMVKVGSVIGVGTTILVVILTGVAGAWLARMEGFSTMMRVRESLNQGKMPADEMVEGLLILVAGILLLTPGFITDCMGLSMLLPFTRKPLARWLRKQFGASVQMHGAGGMRGGNSAGFTYYTWHSSGAGSARSQEDPFKAMREAMGEQSDKPAPRQAMVIDCDPIDTSESPKDDAK